MRFLIPLTRFDTSGNERVRHDREQGHPLAQQDADRSSARRGRASFAPFERQPPPFALQLRHRPASGMADDRFRRKPNTITLSPRPLAPIFILRHAVLEAADRIEHRPPHEHRRGDREVEVFDVALVLKREHALERFGRRHPLADLRPGRRLVPPTKSAEPQLREALLEPARVRSTIAVDERDRLASRSANASVAGGSSAALRRPRSPARGLQRSHERRRARANCRCRRQ